MGDWLGTLVGLLGLIFRPDQLVKRRTGALLVLLVGATTALVLYEKDASNWWWGVLVPAAGSSILIWWSLREIYFRQGGKRRLGIAYDSFKTDYEDWRKTKELLIDLFRDRDMPSKVAIRHVPSYFVNTQEKWTATVAKYGFMAILNVKASHKKEDSAEQVFDIKMQAHLKAELDEGFSAELAKTVGLLGQHVENVPSTLRKVELQANTIYHSLVLFLGIYEMTSGNLIEAGRLFSHLEARLASEYSITQEPRRYTRWMETCTLLLPSTFSAKAPPVAEDMLIVKGMAVAALEKYGDQFPEISPGVARACFFAADFDKAYAITIEFAKRNLPATSRVVTTLNLGVLSLLKGDWASACDNIRKYLASSDWKTIDGQSLIEFADVTRQMGYEAAIYLQVFYRLLFGQVVADSQWLECSEWVSQDGSRDGLRILLNKLKELGVDRLRQKLATIKLLPSDYASHKKRKGEK